MSISKKILEHPVLILCTFVLIAIVSAFTLGNINIALMPDMDIPVAMVSTSYPNAGPETVEKSVTQVLESSLISVTNLKKMTSTSSEGMSSISLQFNYGTDMDVAVNELRDKIDKVKQALPTNASTPSIFQFDMSSMPIIMLAVNGNRSEESLKKIADEQIADLLEQADGVAQASVRGGRSAIVRIELDQNRLEAYGLTLSSIARGLSSQNIEVGGGSVSEGTKKYTVRTTGEFESIDDINHSVVGTYNGYDVKLEDIGTASMGYSDVTSKIYINGKHGVYVSVQKQSGSNTVNVAKAVKGKIKEIEKTLPTDINIEIISDDSTSVSDTLTELIKSIVQGFILSVIVLFIFLRSGRSTFIMAISIPFCILITLTAMSFAGNLTTICVFIPFFVFKNKLEMLGQMFSSLMSVILIAILSSLFVAVFLVPVLAGKFLPVSNRKEHPIKNAFLAKCDKRIENALNWLTAQYQKGLHFVLRRRFATVVIAFGIFAASLVLIGRLNISFMSNYNDSSVSLNVTLPLGTKLEETQAILDDFYQFAQNEIKGYDNIVVSIGSGSGGGMSDTSIKGL